MENSVGLSYEKGEDYTEADLLERNKSFLDQITRGLGMQQVRVAGQNFQYIKTPIASLNYKCLHPLLYRNVGNIGELDQLAQILAAPSEWEQYYNEKVAPSSCVARKPEICQTTRQRQTFRRHFRLWLYLLEIA